VEWEGALNANAVADFAQRDGLANTSALAGDDDALEKLNSLFARFADKIFKLR